MVFSGTLAPETEQARVVFFEADFVADALYDFQADECVEYGLEAVRYLPAFDRGIFFLLKSAFTISKAVLSISKPKSLQMLSSAT